MISSILCLVLAMWQDPPLPTELTLDERDEQILRKYGVYTPPVPFPPLLTPENVELFYKTVETQRPTIVDSFGNLIFGIPEFVFDELLLGLRSLGDQDDKNLTSSVLSFDHGAASGHLFPEFLTFFAQQENKFFAGFGDSYLSTPDVERGVADVDMNDLVIEQRKVMWDVLKKTYFSKYKFKAEERIHDDAFYISKWRGVDFITLPPFIAVYLYYRGLDKTFPVYGTQFRFKIEPGMRFLGSSDVIGALVVEWKPTKDFPVGIVASTGMYDHKPQFEFIGIGTSIGEVIKAIRAGAPR